MTKHKKEESLGSSGAKAIVGAGIVKAVADVPKFTIVGMADKALRKSTGLLPKSTPGAFSRAGLKQSFGFARKAAAGSLPGIATFPLLAHGIKDLRSEDPKKKARGMAQVLGAGLTYSAVKGAAEHGARHKMLTGAGAAGKSLKPYLAGAIAKGIPGTLSALIPAIAIAQGLKKKDESSSKSMLRAGIAGGVASGVRGGVEAGLFHKAMGSSFSKKMLKEIVVGTGSKAAAGLAGGVILDRVVRMALKKSDNKPKIMKERLDGV